MCALPVYCHFRFRPATKGANLLASPLVKSNPTVLLAAHILLLNSHAQLQSRSYSLAETGYREVIATLAGQVPVGGDLAAAWEGLGRCVVERSQSNGIPARHLEESLGAFQRALRLAPERNKILRAQVGKSLFLLERFDEASKVFQSLLGPGRRNALSEGSREGRAARGMWYAYLGKSLYRLPHPTLSQLQLAESSLRTSISLAPTCYRTLAFLGEQLHAAGKTKNAQELLLKAIELRFDYPEAHTRLAFIATEKMEREKIQYHLGWAIYFAPRGFVDEGEAYRSERDMDLYRTRDAMSGPTLLLSLYFATFPTGKSSSCTPSPKHASAPPAFDPTASPTRRDIIVEAKRLYPHDALIDILHAISLRRSRSRQERDKGAVRLGSLEEHWRVTLPDTMSKGLLPLVLLGLGKDELAVAAYDRFWQLVSTAGADPPGSNSGEEEWGVQKQDYGFTIMAFFDLRLEGKLSTVR